MFRLHCEFSFSAAHKLKNHEKCGVLHGHNYRVEVFVIGDKLKNGMLIDFHILKKITDKVKEKYDHKYLNDFVEQPTAENLAKLIFDEISSLLSKYNVKLEKVRVWETEKLYAEFSI